MGGGRGGSICANIRINALCTLSRNAYASETDQCILGEIDKFANDGGIFLVLRLYATGMVYAFIRTRLTPLAIVCARDVWYVSLPLAR